MPRKQKSESTSTEPETPSGTATIEQPVTESPNAVPAEPSSTSQLQTFADRVGERVQRAPSPDPFLLALDNAAGIRLFENRRERVMAIQFDEKPSPAIIALVKDAGYRWNQSDRVWTQPVRADSAMSTRIDAERLYQEASKLIREEKGISGQAIPF